MLTCFNKSEGSTESQVVIKIWHKKAKMYKRIINFNIKNKKVYFLENTCSSAIFELRKLESVIFNCSFYSTYDLQKMRNHGFSYKSDKSISLRVFLAENAKIYKPSKI